MKEECLYGNFSITKIFVISGQRQVEMFADAIEASANDRTPSIKVNATFNRSERYSEIYARKKANEVVNTVFNIREYLNETMRRTRRGRFTTGSFEFHVRKIRMLKDLQKNSQ